MSDLTGIGSIADFASSVIERIWPPSASADEKLKASTEIQRMIQDRENVIVQAKAAVMTAELNQEDKVTKRARPAIIYIGLAVIVLNNSIFPMLAWVADAFADSSLPAFPSLTMPSEFWWVWGGVCSLYVLGRTREKSGSATGGMFGKMMNMIAPGKE